MNGPTTHTTTTGHIKLNLIPGHVGENIAQVAFAGILRAYNDPEIIEDYRRWKAERATREGAKA